MPDRRCPREGCSKTITGDLFACSTHWYSLPQAIRHEIYRAYRRWSAGHGSLKALTEAHAAAYGYWGQEGPA